MARRTTTIRCALAAALAALAAAAPAGASPTQESIIQDDPLLLSAKTGARGARCARCRCATRRGYMEADVGELEPGRLRIVWLDPVSHRLVTTRAARVR